MSINDIYKVRTVDASGAPVSSGSDATAANQALTNAALGAPADTAASADTGTFSLIAIAKRIVAKLTTIIAGVPLLAGEAHVGEVGGKLTRVAGTFARPADTTPYAAGDVVSNNATTTTPIAFAGLARVNQGSFYIVSAILATDKKSITPRIRVHIFTDNTATLAGDNLPYKELYADSGKGHRYFDLPAMITGADATNSDMSKSQDNALRFPVLCASASTTIYAVLETLDAFTPASGQNFSLSLQVDNN